MKGPSKQLRPILIASVLALACIVFAYFYAGSSPKKPKENTLTVVPNTAQEKILSIDTDNDGLKDWEETVWSTDPKNPDTDSDNTKDGDEIHAGRNPLIKGPNDSLKDSAYSSFPGKSTTGTSTPETPEDRLGKELFTEYLRYKQSGREITPEIQAELVTKTLSSANQYTLAPSTTYSEKNITVVADTTSNFYDYGNEVGAAFKANTYSGHDTELTLMESAINSGNESDLKKIDEIIPLYKNIVARLLKVKTPKSLSTLHVQLINDYNSVISADESIKKVLSDPLSGFVGLQSYLETASDLSSTHTAIRQKLDSMGITYNATESGYALTH